MAVGCPAHPREAGLQEAHRVVCRERLRERAAADTAAANRSTGQGVPS